MNEVLIVFCTFPEATVARQVGTALVEKQLAACVNLTPAVESVYRWQGKVEISTEMLAIFKTTTAAFTSFERALIDAHPYDVPEIIALKPAAVNCGYRAWVMENVAEA